LSTSSSPSSSSSSSPSPAEVYQQLLDVRVPTSVLLGTGTITVRQALTLDRNSLVELTQSAGEDLLLDVNGVLLARGEIVVVEDGAALRVTEIAPPPPPRAVE
jgi:flagellar motor switch/type III secretory pathway protein FliN